MGGGAPTAACQEAAEIVPHRPFGAQVNTPATQELVSHLGAVRDPLSFRELTRHPRGCSGN